MAEDASNASQEEEAPGGITKPGSEEYFPTNLAFSSILNPHELPAYYFPPAFPNRVLSVPTEVTSVIFEFVDGAWVEFMRDYYHIYNDPGEPPDVPLRPGLALLGVCRLWRQIALGHRKLWATFVHVTPDRLIAPPLLSFYLEQSKPHPLDIVIRAQNFYWPDEDDDELDVDHDGVDYNGHAESYFPWTTIDVRRVLDALITHAPRWRRFSLHICIGGFDTGVLLPIQRVDAPLLERFDVLTHNQWKHEPVKHIKDKDNLIVALRGDEPDPSRLCTKVSRLTFARFDIVALHTFAPSFADLTVLELRNSHSVGLPIKVYTSIFAGAPRLVHVSFMRCTSQIDSEYDESLEYDADEDLIMSAPCLEVLRSFTSDMALYMWKHLKAPRLKDVVICDTALVKIPLWIKDAWEDSFDPDEVQTPFPSLERLVLDYCAGDKLSRSQLLLIGRMTSSITQLVLMRDEHVLDTMIRVGRNPVLWPDLRVLKLASSPHASGFNSNSGDMARLARLVEWRREVEGQQCVIEHDLRCFPINNGEVLRVQLDALVAKGIARLDSFSFSDHPWPEWPPQAGQERPTNVHGLSCVEMLGAPNNPWYY